MRKLTSEDVMQIQADIDKGLTYNRIAQNYGVSHGCISDIARRKTYREVNPDWTPSRKAKSRRRAQPITQEERDQFQKLRSQGLTLTEISQRMGRPAKPIAANIRNHASAIKRREIDEKQKRRIQRLWSRGYEMREIVTLTGFRASQIYRVVEGSSNV